MRTDNSFSGRTKVALVDLRNITRVIISSLLGSNITGAALARKLKINTTLSWMLLNFIQSEDVFKGSQYIPARYSFMKFLEKSGKLGVKADYLDKAENSYEAYSSLIKRYTGDRSSFDLILQGMSEEGSRKAFQEQKKQKFLAERFLNGISASTNFNLTIMPRQAADDSIIEVRGLTNLTRFRESSCNVYKPHSYTVEDQISKEGLTDFPLTALALEDDNPGPIPYYSRFCSCRMPQPDTGHQELFIEDIIPEELVDVDTHINLVTGLRVKEPSPELVLTSLFFWAESNFPCESFIMDSFVHRELGIDNPRIRVFNQIDLPHNPVCDRAYRKDDKYRFKYDENLIKLTGGALSAQISEISWYSEMVADIFEIIGEKSEEYDLFRVKIEYPYIPSLVMMSIMEYSDQ